MTFYENGAKLPIKEKEPGLKMINLPHKTEQTHVNLPTQQV